MKTELGTWLRQAAPQGHRCEWRRSRCHPRADEQRTDLERTTRRELRSFTRKAASPSRSAERLQGRNPDLMSSLPHISSLVPLPLKPSGSQRAGAPLTPGGEGQGESKAQNCGILLPNSTSVYQCRIQTSRPRFG